MKIFLLILMFGTLPLLNSYNILAVFPVCAYSHYTLAFKLIEALISKGHNVTMISCFTQKIPIRHLHELSIEDDMKFLYEKAEKQFLGTTKYTHFGKISWSLDISNEVSLNILKSKAIEELMNSNATFDVMIMENIMIDAVSILRYRFKCPLIVETPFSTEIIDHNYVENLFSSAYVPNLFGTYDSHLNFWERLQNTYRQIVSELLMQFKYIPSQRRIIHELFPDAPDLYEGIYNVSLYLVSSNPSLNDPIPLQPNIKEIGGHHVSPPKPLPKDIETFMNTAEDGVILFSMGSFINSSTLETHVKQVILKTFSKMKQKFVWSYKGNDLVAPDNVMIRKWIPQNDVMAHPKTIAFISHGGLLGTYEAIYNGVPILGLPVAWDQMKNIEEAARKGFAIRLNLEDFTEDDFEKALHEIITNTNYRKVAKERSRIMHDRISTPLDEAVFWIEYVVRHKGAHHLRSSVMDLKWYQRYLIDIFMFITLILLLVVYLIFLFIKTAKHLKLKRKQD